MIGMYKIVTKLELAPAIKLFEVSAHRIARKAKPGQFVILRIDEKGERIPITLASFDASEGTVTMVFHEVGNTTKKLGRLNEGDYILNLSGPLGNPANIKKYGRVLCIGGGVMIAPLYLQATALRRLGNEVISVIGARSSTQLIFEKEMQEISDELYIATDDGSKGYTGVDFIKDLLNNRKIDRVIAIGPIVMMKTVAEITRPHGIPTVVNLNPIMVDGMGMCGACRVTVGGETKFACVDGPDFDGHLVDFEELMARRQMYVSQEKLSLLFHEETGRGMYVKEA